MFFLLCEVICLETISDYSRINIVKYLTSKHVTIMEYFVYNDNLHFFRNFTDLDIQKVKLNNNN